MSILNSELAVTVIGGLLTLIGIVVGEVLRRQGKALNEVRENAAVAREQTANSHGTNLRDDLDRAIDGINQLLVGQVRHDELLAAQSQQLSDVKQDIAWERRERMDLARLVLGKTPIA